MNRTPEQNQFRVVLDHYSEYSDVWARMRFALCAFFGIVSQKCQKGLQSASNLENARSNTFAMAFDRAIPCSFLIKEFL